MEQIVQRKNLYKLKTLKQTLVEVFRKQMLNHQRIPILLRILILITKIKEMLTHLIKS